MGGNEVLSGVPELVSGESSPGCGDNVKGERGDGGAGAPAAAGAPAGVGDPGLPPGPKGQRQKNPSSGPPSGSRGIALPAESAAGHSTAGRSSPRRPVPYEVRLAAVKLHLEEGLPENDVCEALGVCRETLNDWLKRYRTLGADGLHPLSSVAAGRRGREQVPAAVKERIVELKQANPGFGIRRISQILGRLLFMRASPETVRATLADRQLMDPPAQAKPKRAPAPPRFFERSTPNQMWQSDISTFRIAGKTVYLIGFVDDYSRYVTGLGLYRTQSTENVLELYRRATADYGPPKEMLTDNGRQYAAWRGKTRFQTELQKSGIHHIRSTPHHPMTLGKIERFWQTVKSEFLDRTAFGSLDEGAERLRFWVNWYNHRRPNQGINGLCPADRYFEIRADVRKVMEQGMEENQLELALRGRPQRPFYMVGRLDERSVVMQTRGGKLVMTVSDGESHKDSELVCDLNEGTLAYENRSEGHETPAAALHGVGEVPGRAAGVDREAQRHATGPGAGVDLDGAEPVAGAGDGGDARRPGAQAADGAEALSPECAPAAAPGPQVAPTGAGDPGPAGRPREASGRAPGDGGGGAPVPEALKSGSSAPPSAESPRSAANAPVGAQDMSPELMVEALRLALGDAGLLHYLKTLRANGPEAEDGVQHGYRQNVADSRRAGQAPSRADRGSPLRAEDSRPGSGGAGGLPQDLVQVGEPGTGSHGRGPDRPADGTAEPAGSGPREAQDGGGAVRPAPAGAAARNPGPDPGTDAHGPGAAGCAGSQTVRPGE